MKFIPLANLKNTTGIVTTCKEEKELKVANKNGVPALVLMSREDKNFWNKTKKWILLFQKPDDFLK